jgi:hypothetical protein
LIIEVIKKQEIEETDLVENSEKLDQVAGHSGGFKSILVKGDSIWKPLNQVNKKKINFFRKNMSFMKKFHNLIYL